MSEYHCIRLSMCAQMCVLFTNIDFSLSCWSQCPWISFFMFNTRSIICSLCQMSWLHNVFVHLPLVYNKWHFCFCDLMQWYVSVSGVHTCFRGSAALEKQLCCWKKGLRLCLTSADCHHKHTHTFTHTELWGWDRLHQCYY